ncbi:hypothetical protein KAU33_13715, partial [Candidatus Dependentiae bacterium]|nr:hypothetical protein [Candidatus Dependentiae bacterium]
LFYQLFWRRTKMFILIKILQFELIINLKTICKELIYSEQNYFPVFSLVPNWYPVGIAVQETKFLEQRTEI